MSSAFNSLYVNLANGFNDFKAFPPTAVDSVYSSLLSVISFTNSDDVNATEVVNNILSSVYAAYNEIRYITYAQVQVINAVRAINDTVINVYGGEDTSYLTEFVNSVNWGPHELSCVPIYWAQLSEEAGYDISDWDICS